MADARALAAANNAAWCDRVCRSHGLATVFAADAWTCALRAPTYYPDAVALVPDLSIPALLARIAATPGCSIKDSFASLDLAPWGFRVLFEASWLVRERSAAVERPAPVWRWEVVHDETQFTEWERAWRGDDGPAGVLRSDLMGDPSIAVVGGYDADGTVVAGGVLNRDASCVGISNVFALGDESDEAWAALVGLAEERFGPETFVGYESGAALRAAARAGFVETGPLRVWMLKADDDQP